MSLVMQVPGIVQQQKQSSNSSVELAAWRWVWILLLASCNTVSRKARVEAGKRGETLRD